jgi:hypothetical protein
MLPELPRVAKLNDRRRKWLQARWRDHPEHQSLDWWRTFFETVRSRPFLMGDNPRAWRADLEWLVKEGNFLKVVEGHYRDTAGGNHGTERSGHRGKSAVERNREGSERYLRQQYGAAG